MRINANDRVAYSVQFLKSIGESQGPMAHARGTVRELIPRGEVTIAAIDWAEGDWPDRVNVANLAKVGPNRRFSNVD